jgi:Arc/MetJ-type ribon-helix-helix transcriptional regulator
MKISVSLPAVDVEYLDSYARAQGHTSRSAVLQRAVRTLRSTELGGSYEDAWDTWESSGEASLWESATGDGLAP